MGLFIVTVSRTQKSNEGNRKSPLSDSDELYRIFIYFAVILHSGIFVSVERTSKLIKMMNELSFSPPPTACSRWLFYLFFNFKLQLIWLKIQSDSKTDNARDKVFWVYLCIVSSQHLDQSSRLHTRCDTCSYWMSQWQEFSVELPLSAAPHSSDKCRGSEPNTWATMSANEWKTLKYI